MVSRVDSQSTLIPLQRPHCLGEVVLTGDLTGDLTRTGSLTGSWTGQSGLIKRGQIDHAPDITIIPMDHFQVACFGRGMVVSSEMYVA